LVDQIDFKQNGVTRMTTTKQWDKLNRLTNIVSTTNAVAANQSSFGYSLANQRSKNPHEGFHCFDASEGRQIVNHAFIPHPRNDGQVLI
jgi:predicted sugar kinase